MAADNSFDIVSKVDIQEVRNAIEQAIKEVRARFDLKDSHSEIKLEGDDAIQLASVDEYKLEAVKEILSQKLVKRGISLKALTYGKLEPATGSSVRQKITLQQGIPTRKPKRSSASLKTRKRRPRHPYRGYCSGQQQRSRYSTGGDRAAEGQRPRHRHAVYELPVELRTGPVFEYERRASEHN